MATRIHSRRLTCQASLARQLHNAVPDFEKWTQTRFRFSARPVQRVRHWSPPALAARRQAAATCATAKRAVVAGLSTRAAETTECAFSAQFGRMLHMGRCEGAGRASKFSLANPQDPTRSTPSLPSDVTTPSSPGGGSLPLRKTGRPQQCPILPPASGRDPATDPCLGDDSATSVRDPRTQHALRPRGSAGETSAYGTTML